jgi:hypothetical protein
MTSTPFRQDALALAATDAAPVLAKWDAEKLPFGLRLALFVIGKQYAPVRGEGGPEELSGAAAGLGLRFLGHVRFAGLIPLFGPVREAWTDRDGLVRVSFRQVGPYILTTMFDDGTAITTWSSQVSPSSNAMLTNRAGTGDLALDYEAHRAAVGEHAGETRVALRISDLATALAMSTHYDRRLSPKAIVELAQARVVVLLVLAIAAALPTLRR